MDVMGIMAQTKGRGATVHLLRKRLMGVSPLLLAKRTKSYSCISKSVESEKHFVTFCYHGLSWLNETGVSISSAPLNITKGLKTLGEDILWYRERGANDGGIPRISRGMEGGGVVLVESTFIWKSSVKAKISANWLVGFRAIKKLAMHTSVSFGKPYAPPSLIVKGTVCRVLTILWMLL